ncbi:hypothetical protein SDC9_154568 [bioreactor metagenome]|uniref:Uncharacterized protein n=1 Tax=bioreactor metagenome TaxID=1076179 RepID=A0A645F1B8_9ZZZZ
MRRYAERANAGGNLALQQIDDVVFLLGLPLEHAKKLQHAELNDFVLERFGEAIDDPIFDDLQQAVVRQRGCHKYERTTILVELANEVQHADAVQVV